jgi:Tetratricopeptide repeat
MNQDPVTRPGRPASDSAHPPPATGRRGVESAGSRSESRPESRSGSSRRASARRSGASGRQDIIPFNFLPDEAGGDHRLGWIARVGPSLITIVAWTVALVYLAAGGVLLVLLGPGDTQITGALVIGLAVLLAITGVITLGFAWRTHSSVRALRAAHRLVKDGNQQEAIPALTRLLADGRLPGIRHVTRFLLGKALAAEGRTREAAEAWKNCPDFWPAWNNLGTLLMEAGKLHQAERAFRHAIRLNPHEPLLYNHLALALQRRDEPVLARGVLELSLKHARSKATRRNLDRLDAGESIDVDGILPSLRAPWAGWM